jgi:hypothetical protein
LGSELLFCGLLIGTNIRRGASASGKRLGYIKGMAKAAATADACSVKETSAVQPRWGLA